jgi:ribosomal-protein-alanine N-acetyltransferase
MLQAELEQPAELGSLLRVEVPAAWPPPLYDADAIRYALRRIGEYGEVGWWWWYFVLRAPHRTGLLIGAGGYKGPPYDGEVEIGYSIIPQFQRQGFASEATSGLIAHAFSQPDVEVVSAETFPALIGSVGVLRKCGFSYVGPGADDGVIRYQITKRHWLRQLRRDENPPAQC